MKIQVCRLEVKQEYIDVEKLTDKQLEYIKIIEDYKSTYKVIPSFRQICKLMNYNSPGTIYNMMNKLYKKGYDYRII